MKYAKFWAAVVGAVVTAALQFGLTGTWQQILTLASVAATAITVYSVPNKPQDTP